MEKFSFIKDGVTSKLPPGFRFQPTDKEIVFQYLARKIFSYPLPASIIPEITISSSGPWSFPTGDSDQERYFFINKANYGNRERAVIPTRAGFWRAMGPGKRIVSSKTMPLVGIKRTLVFYEGPNTRTDWIMHEYCVTALTTAACTIQQKKKISPGSLVPIGNWVLCHLFMKKTSEYKGRIEQSAGLGSYSSSSSTSSASNSSMDSDSSSIITEVSSDIVPDDESVARI
ncbi:NAC transcription factor 25-like [Dorcoceras hygrometricum]|uniref:NAC transcription factor 25-like n=1 Tax=Dorcoceras hygrometricum TaxID=472368 RepID=A0A2Z7B2Z8_9LAMI|nr:NAC transcription factor 25-like [Dorcoceras hygrometricum]